MQWRLPPWIACQRFCPVMAGHPLPGSRLLHGLPASR
ncbi:hypothetical protein SGRIM128S_01027 [Streptomyces griseomycini]